HGVVEARLCPNIELYFEIYSEKGQRKGGFESHWRQNFADTSIRHVIVPLLLPTITKVNAIDKRHSVVEARLCPNIELYFEYYSERVPWKGAFEFHWGSNFANSSIRLVLVPLLLSTISNYTAIVRCHSVVEARLCPNIELYFENYSEKGQRKGGFDSHWRQHF